MTRDRTKPPKGQESRKGSRKWNARETPPRATKADARREPSPRLDAPPRPRPQREAPRAAIAGKREPSPREPSPRADAPPFRRPASDLVALYGFHAVREALAARKRRLIAIFATPAAAEKLAPEIAGAGLVPHIVEAAALSRRLGPDAVHQGVMLEARPSEPRGLADIEPASGIVLVLDQITDPHNVGAILRTAAAFRVDAIVMTQRHAPELTGALAKAASGGLEHTPVVHVVNLARALETLGEIGYLRVGLDSGGQASLADITLARPLALVLGGEGKGLRRLTRENCDAVARLDMAGPIKSLNVSTACAVALTLADLRLTDRLR